MAQIHHQETQHPTLDRRVIAKFGLAALAIASGAYVVSSYLHRPSPITIEGISSDPRARAVAVVQVSGAVRKPQVVKLTTEHRVEEALEGAGGPTRDADMTRINRAAKLVDGTVLFIPSIADGDYLSCDPAYVIGMAPRMQGFVGPSATKQSPPRSSGKKSPPPDGSINLNTATAQELDQLPGVGPATAAKIIEYRMQHGTFRSIDELLAVKGIGPKKLEAMRRFLRL